MDVNENMKAWRITPTDEDWHNKLHDASIPDVRCKFCVAGMAEPKKVEAEDKK